MDGRDRPTLKIATLPSLRDIYRIGASLADEELSFATRRYEQTLERRDKLRERTRFGLLALNAASLVGLLSSGQWAAKFGVSDNDLGQSLLGFLVGIISGAIAIWWSQIVVTRDAADDFEHLVGVRQRKAEYDSAATVEAERSLVDRPLPDVDVLPDYRWSRVDNILTNLAGASWLAAVGGFAWAVAKQVQWNWPWFS